MSCLQGDLWSFLVALSGRVTKSECNFGLCRFSSELLRTEAHFVFVFRESRNTKFYLRLFSYVSTSVATPSNENCFKPHRQNNRFEIQITNFSFHLLFICSNILWHILETLSTNVWMNVNSPLYFIKKHIWTTCSDFNRWNAISLTDGPAVSYQNFWDASLRPCYFPVSPPSRCYCGSRATLK